MARTRKTPRVNIGQTSPNGSVVSQRNVNLTVENVVEVLLDSDDRHDEALKANAVEFILMNAVEVIQSPSWPMVYQSSSLRNQLLIELHLFVDHYEDIKNSSSFQDLDIETRMSIFTAAFDKMLSRNDPNPRISGFVPLSRDQDLVIDDASELLEAYVDREATEAAGGEEEIEMAEEEEEEEEEEE